MGCGRPSRSLDNDQFDAEVAWPERRRECPPTFERVNEAVHERLDPEQPESGRE